MAQATQGSAAKAPRGLTTAQQEFTSFLRTRRAKRQPEDVGLPSNGRRRTPGLRREELAVLAGISTDYYTRLEQGRETRPSPSVLRALANALGLSLDEHAYLRSLVIPEVSAQPPRPPESHQFGSDDELRPGVALLLESLHDNPAYLVNRRLDVLAWNPIAAALFGDFARLEPGHRNIAWMIFRDPEYRALHRDWEVVAHHMLANLRVQTALHRRDLRLTQLVADLSINDEQFRIWWARQGGRAKRSGLKRLRHKVVGDMDLHYEVLMLPDVDERWLAVFSAEPGSPSAEALAKLREQSPANRR
ncbi:MAG: helix-turn-helix domain-containing protein [Stackebrandtia sp.]